jgi:hypothetical protein
MASAGVTLMQVDGAGSMAQLLSCFSAESGTTCFVIVQDVGAGSVGLGKYLAPHCPLPIHEAAVGMAVEEGHLYLVTGSPPVSVAQGRFVAEIDAGSDLALAFPERFRRGLDQEPQRKAICFVLNAAKLGEHDALAVEEDSGRHSR